MEIYFATVNIGRDYQLPNITQLGAILDCN